MAEFPEHIKKEVKRKAAFQCCMCHASDVHIHHIIQPKDDGDDTIENAAPLCPNCHDLYGDNPNKVKEIRQRRDWWYERVENMYGGSVGIEILSQISRQLQDISSNQASQATELAELKNNLRNVVNNAIDNITPATAATSAFNLLSASTASMRLVDEVAIDVFRRCPNCDTRVELAIGSNNCPRCGAQIG